MSCFSSCCSSIFALSLNFEKWFHCVSMTISFCVNYLRFIGVQGSECLSFRLDLTRFLSTQLRTMGFTEYIEQTGQKLTGGNSNVFLAWCQNSFRMRQCFLWSYLGSWTVIFYVSRWPERICLDPVWATQESVRLAEWHLQAATSVYHTNVTKLWLQNLIPLLFSV